MIMATRRKRMSSGLDGLLIGVEDVERNIGCARLGRAIHGARGSGPQTGV